MQTNDNRFINTTIEDGEIWTFESETIIMKMDAGLIVGSFQKEKKSPVLGIDMEFRSNYAISFNVSESYLIDNSGHRLFPHGDSQFRADNHYQKDKQHGIGIVFVTKGKENYINLPVKLHLPPLVFIEQGDTLSLPIIEIK